MNGKCCQIILIKPKTFHYQWSYCIISNVLIYISAWEVLPDSCDKTPNIFTELWEENSLSLNKLAWLHTMFSITMDIGLSVIKSILNVTHHEVLPDFPIKHLKQTFRETGSYHWISVFSDCIQYGPSPWSQPIQMC